MAPLSRPCTATVQGETLLVRLPFKALGVASRAPRKLRKDACVARGEREETEQSQEQVPRTPAACQHNGGLSPPPQRSPNEGSLDHRELAWPNPLRGRGPYNCTAVARGALHNYLFYHPWNKSQRHPSQVVKKVKCALHLSLGAIWGASTGS